MGEFGFDLEPDAWIKRVRRAVSPAGQNAPNDDDRSEDAPERPGTRVGAYVLVAPIGSGGMGMVWRARRDDSHFRRSVAIKMIKRGMDTADVLHRFRIERQVLAGLEHPNIARLYDGGATIDGRPFLVMELVEGRPIDNYCNEESLGIEERLELFRQVCLSVHHAHTNLVLHRDLKPSNVLVDADGHPKLLDFGIAKVLSADGSAVTGITVTEQRVLTPRYASPEQVRGDRVSTASDTYSLGVILYELLTGARPYQVDDDSRSELERAITHLQPPRPSTAIQQQDDLTDADKRRLTARLRGDLDTIVMKALEKKPSDRYQSAQQLAEDIQRHVEGLPLLAKRAGAIRKFTRTVRRHRASIVVGAVAATLALLVTATAITYGFMAPRWADQHTKEAHSYLLSANTFNVIWILTFYNAPSSTTKPNANLQILGDAIDHLSSARRFDPSDEKASDEFHVIQLARDISRNVGARPDIAPAFKAAAPLTCAYAADWATSREIPNIDKDQLTRASNRDLRCLGLLSVLCGNTVLTLDAWSRLETVDADPLVESLLGVLYLAVEKPELAYPKLLSAYRTYPRNGYLCMMLADAAVRCNELSLAKHLLDGAGDLPNQDTLQGLRRVRMQYLLASGEEQQAEKLYYGTELHTSSVAAVFFSDFLFSKGQRRKALGVLVERCDQIPSPENRHMVPRRTDYQMLILTNRWWRDLDTEEREALVRQAGRESRDDAESLFRISRTYQRSAERLNRLHAESVIDSETIPLGPQYDLANLTDSVLIRLHEKLMIPTIED